MAQALLCLSLAALVRGKHFRNSQTPESLEDTFLQTVHPSDIEEAQTRVSGFEDALRTSFAALPKNEADRLELQSARYILHRLFVQRSGWYVKGLEPAGNLFGTGGLDLRWVPDSLQNVIGYQSASWYPGVSLRDLAVLGVAIERVADEEVVETMHDIFEHILRSGGRSDMKPAEEEEGEGEPPALGPEAAQRAVHTYMAFFLGNGFYTLRQAYLGQLAEKFAFWNTTVEWFQPLQEAVLQKIGLGAADPLPFSALVNVAQAFSRHYVAYNNLECNRLKQGLVGAWSLGASTGRLRLADFHKLGLSDDQFLLGESMSFLRELGALDESNLSVPMVMIPNYLASTPNCLKATKQYHVCCRNECEELLGHLELKIGAPAAEASRVLELVRGLGSETVAAPREVSPSLQGLLESIAATHGGAVPLHGRLFAQWMHHAYPSECPYPHVAGSTNPLSAANDDAEASDEELKSSAAKADVCSPEQAASEWQSELPWSDDEELLSAHALKGNRRRGLSQATRCIGMLLMVLGTAALFRSGRARALSKRQRFVALSLMLLLALAMGLVNRALVVLMCACMLLSRHGPMGRSVCMKAGLPMANPKHDV